MERPRIYGHRGAKAHARENTAEACALAIHQGADGVELDARRSGDGELIVHHEDRPEAGAQPFIEQDLTTIKALWPWVPTLDEAWLAIGDEAMLNIEIKNDPSEADFDESRAIAGDVVRWVERQGRPDRILVSSFDRPALDVVRAADIRTGLLTTSAVDAGVAIDLAKDGGHVSVHLPVPIAMQDSAGIVAAARPLDVLVWTVNDPAIAVALAAGGVAGIFTDDPLLMVSLFS